MMVVNIKKHTHDENTSDYRFFSSLSMFLRLLLMITMISYVALLWWSTSSTSVPETAIFLLLGGCGCKLCTLFWMLFLYVHTFCKVLTHTTYVYMHIQHLSLSTHTTSFLLFFLYLSSNQLDIIMLNSFLSVSFKTSSLSSLFAFSVGRIFGVPKYHTASSTFAWEVWQQWQVCCSSSSCGISSSCKITRNKFSNF